MHRLQLYDHLQRFTLFQGLSRTELQQLVGNTRFGFHKLPPHKRAVESGAPCRQLLFLVGGSLTLTAQSDDHGYTVTEQLAAPFLLQPEVLFGPQPRYTFTATTNETSHFITLSKSEVLQLCEEFLIVRLNLLNLLAQQAQRHAHRPWRSAPHDLRQSMVRFFVDHCVYPAGPKTFAILMKRLAAELNVSRLDVSRQLNAMQHDGLLHLHRGRIDIPMLEHLLM